MSNITINAKAHTIEMSKKYAELASRFGTPEYDDLQKARRDYPNYRIVTKSVKSGKCAYSGLTYEFMEKYITAHDNEEHTILAEYNLLRAKSEEAIEIGMESASYTEVKDWFLDKFPAIAEFHKKREELLKKVAEAKKKREEENNTAKKVA